MFSVGGLQEWMRKARKQVTIFPLIFAGVDCGKPDLSCIEEVSLLSSGYVNSSVDFDDLHAYNHTLYGDTWHLQIPGKWLVRMHFEDGVVDYRREVNLTCNYTALWNNAITVNCTGIIIGVYHIIYCISYTVPN